MTSEPHYLDGSASISPIYVQGYAVGYRSALPGAVVEVRCVHVRPAKIGKRYHPVGMVVQRALGPIPPGHASGWGPWFEAVAISRPAPSADAPAR